MLGFILGFLSGAFLGWFFLPIPQYAVKLLDKLIAKFPILAAFTRKD